MKLKLGAQRDPSAFSKESNENINDSAISSSCVEGMNVESNFISASASSSKDIQSSGSDSMMIIDTDCSSISTSPNCNQPRHSEVSIIHFFSKFKDSRRTNDSSYVGESESTENGFPGSVSSASESHYRSETECTQSSPVCELSE